MNLNESRSSRWLVTTTAPGNIITSKKKSKARLFRNFLSLTCFILCQVCVSTAPSKRSRRGSMIGGYRRRTRRKTAVVLWMLLCGLCGLWMDEWMEEVPWHFFFVLLRAISRVSLSLLCLEGSSFPSCCVSSTCQGVMGVVWVNAWMSTSGAYLASIDWRMFVLIFLLMSHRQKCSMIKEEELRLNQSSRGQMVRHHGIFDKGGKRWVLAKNHRTNHDAAIVRHHTCSFWTLQRLVRLGRYRWAFFIFWIVKLDEWIKRWWTLDS